MLLSIDGKFFLLIFQLLPLEILYHFWYNINRDYFKLKRITKMIDKKHIGSSFDSFLEEENILQESEAVAIKRVIAYALEQKMLADNISVNRLAKELATSRTAICRILDPENTSITLNTIEKVAKYLGKRIVLSFA